MKWVEPSTNEIITQVKIHIIFPYNALNRHTHVHAQSYYLKHLAGFFSLGIKNFLPWQSERCHQCYMTPLPLTCSIVRIMLSDHFNRLLGYRFSWVCRMRDEAGSWGGVLKNNTKCSISFPQSGETADKLRHSREENTHKVPALCAVIHIHRWIIFPLPLIPINSTI